jgi:hypothetical protein
MNSLIRIKRSIFILAMFLGRSLFKTSGKIGTVKFPNQLFKSDQFSPLGYKDRPQDKISHNIIEFYHTHSNEHQILLSSINST